jgi:hypothetical protein
MAVKGEAIPAAKLIQASFETSIGNSAELRRLANKQRE